jgi:glycosyltransferase involved in cell wall biosynthesis
MSVPVSVICTFFNAEDTLEETLESLRRQIAEAAEFVMIDDSSTDRSASIAEAFCAEDRRFILHTNPVRGRGHALNYGVAKASGKYVAVLDADDVAHPGWLKSAYRAMEEYPDFAVIGFDRLFIGAGERPLWSADPGVANAAPTNVSKRVARENPVPHSGAVIRKRWLLALGGYAAERGSHFDYDLWIRIVGAGGQIGKTELVRIAKRYHAGQKFAARNGYFFGSLLLQVQAIRAIGDYRDLPWPAVRIAKRLARWLRRSARGQLSRR